MFTLLFRKMRKTKWMVLCLFMGFLMAAGMMSTVPIYMDASLQRMLIKDMEQYQLNTNQFPGAYVVSKTLQFGVDVQAQQQVIKDVSKSVQDRLNAVGIPVSNSKIVLRDDFKYVVNASTNGSNSTTRIKIVGMTDFYDHIKIVKGSMPSKEPVNGVYEVLATEGALKLMSINYGNEYDILSMETSKETVKIKIVGIYEQLSDNDSYWAETMDPYVNAIFVDYDLFLNDLQPSGKVELSDIFHRSALDYQSMDMNNISSVTSQLQYDKEFYANKGYKYEMGVQNILFDYTERAASLTRILWILQIPAMVMLAFYLFMVSQLNVDQERNEIAVFKSRGASSKQIFAMYSAEAGILGVITLIVAPFIGLALCQFLGVSNGFLEFVNRTGIAAKITWTAIMYALLAVVIFFTTTLIPIIPASKLTIVEYKQSKTKVVKMSLWEKCFVDILLIAASIGFLYYYVTNLNTSVTEGTFAATGEIDPLLFIFSTLLIMGLGLLFIRVYPYLLRLIYVIGKPFWSPAQYMAITSVCRSQGGKERFLMLFLVITFSFGLFSANTARAINNNKEDRIYYENGADVTITEHWSEQTDESGTEYIETDFERYENLEGVEQATKVLKVDKAKIGTGKNEPEVTMMAIEPTKFAQISWFRDDLLPVHWWNYCNALVDAKQGVLVSTALAEKQGLQLKDNITVRWGKNDPVDVVVMAIVDYWPGLNPNSGDFVVMNYSYVHARTILEPYQIWLKLKDGATSEALYDSITKSRLPISSVNDSSQKVISEKTDPSLQGMNGALTLGFIIIMIMTIIGFLIYWILSIRSRNLQFGVLRAMGMSFKEIIGILGYEQILVSGVSIAMAFIIGGVTSDLFVPLFQSMYNVVDQIPPFRVAAMQSDYIKIYILIVLMLGGGFAILGSIIKKININKALKLGED